MQKADRLSKSRKEIRYEVWVLKDIKNGEYRVVMTPAEANILVSEGTEVYVAHNAGYAAGFDDEV